MHLYGIKTNIIFILILNTVVHCGLSAQLVINEVQALNTLVIQDPLFNEFSDWIEIYNGNTSAVDVSGYFLSDDLQSPSKWQIPSGTIIPAYGYLVIWADGRDIALHTNFSINGDGEELGFFDLHGNIIDTVTFQIQYSNISYGRNISGTDWAFFTTPSPGGPNSVESYTGISGEPEFSIAGGFFTSGVSLNLYSVNVNALVRYTTDGSEPDINSLKFTSPLWISSTTIVRARIYEDGYLPGRIVSHSFFINEATHDLPVLSIFTAADNLWDPQNGIYINYEEDYEVPCGIEYFTPGNQSAFSQNAGLSIFGGTSRGKPQKSFSIHTRDIYVDRIINYPLLPGRETTIYKSFILRNSANDWSGNWRGTMFRDALIQVICENQGDLDYQAYQPVAIYLNGAYWGILNLRDKHNEDYCELLYDIDGDSVDIIKNNDVVAGNDFLYNQMMTFLANNDLSVAANYDVASSMIDVDEFINYMITEIYSCNIDWPANNHRLWRPQTDGGKWRWMLFDTDFGFNGFQWALPSTNMFTKALDPNIDDYVRTGLKAPWATMVFIKLTQNETFRNKFISTFISRVNTTYEPARVIHIIDSLANNLENEMPLHINRWSGQGGIISMPAWRQNIQGMKDFANHRPAFAIQHLIETFGLNSDNKVNVEIHCEEGGLITLDGIPMDNKDYNAEYFSGLPLSLSLETIPGYRFTEWIITDLSDEYAEPLHDNKNPIELTLSKPIRITAHVREDINVPVLRINEIMAGNTGGILDEWGDSDDWIEIYNAGFDTVDIGGLFMSDSHMNPTKWKIPPTQSDITKVKPGGFILLWADNELNEGVLHLGFKLDKSGEQVGIYKQLKEELVMIDSITFSSLSSDISFGRYPNGSGPWTQFINPTPGYDNIPTAIQQDYSDLTGPVIYPNPTTGVLNIRSDFLKSVGQEIMVSIINYAGNEVRKLTFIQGETVVTDLSDLPAGFYLVRIQIDGVYFTKKLLIIK